MIGPCHLCDRFQRELYEVYREFRLAAAERLIKGLPVPADVIEGIAVCGYSLERGVADA